MELQTSLLFADLDMSYECVACDVQLFKHDFLAVAMTRGFVSTLPHHIRE